MRVLVIGAGVVGSATGKGLRAWGHDVTFVDTSPAVVRRLQRDGYDATMRLSDTLAETSAEVAFISVPTPSAEDGSVSLSALDSAVRFLGMQLRNSSSPNPLLVVVRSTVPPGTTRHRVMPMLRQMAGPSPAVNYSVCFHPEFLRAVSAEEDFLRSWTLVAGIEDGFAEDTLRAVYGERAERLIVADLETAEMIKYTSNCFNATKISFANEVWLLASSLGVDGNRVLGIASEAAEGYWNPKYGTLGGRPFGGTCLPKDTLGLQHLAREHHVEMPLLSAVIQVNRRREQIEEATIAGPHWEPAPERPAVGRPVAA
jgi:UDPglucose 6-dehydrogenase